MYMGATELSNSQIFEATLPLLATIKWALMGRICWIGFSGGKTKFKQLTFGPQSKSYVAKGIAGELLRAPAAGNLLCFSVETLARF